jgi:hypothetical protein
MTVLACGNGIIDGNETCDSGEGCTPSCTCNSTTHQPYSPPRPSCQPIYNQVQSPSTSSTSQSLLGTNFTNLMKWNHNIQTDSI